MEERPFNQFGSWQTRYGSPCTGTNGKRSSQFEEEHSDH